MKLELFYPTKPPRINQKFGTPATAELAAKYTELGMKGHNGWDFWAPDGWIVRATHDGIVTYSGEDGAGGTTIVIRTVEKYEYEGVDVNFKTVYCHFKKDGLLVKAGQAVKAGDTIGLADNTGMSTGSHLHFGVKPIFQGEQDWQWFNMEQNNGYFGAIDPAPYWNNFCAEDAPKIASLKKTRDLVNKLIGNYPILAKPLASLILTLTTSINSYAVKW